MSELQPASGHRQRLRERLAQHPETLSEHEQVELLLAYAIPRQDVAPLAEALLARFGGIAGLLAAAEAGVGTVILPLENGQEVAHLPDYIRDRLEVRYVSDIQEVLALALFQ